MSGQPQRWLSTMQRGTPLLDMTEKERRLVSFVLGHGRLARFTIYTGGNVGRVLAMHMSWSPRMVERAISDLTERGWMQVTYDAQDRKTVKLTRDLWLACDTALSRHRVRSALGVNRCETYKVTPEMCDQVLKEVELLAEPIFKRQADALRWVFKARYEIPSRS